MFIFYMLYSEALASPKLPYRMVHSFTLISPSSLRGWLGRTLTFNIHNFEVVDADTKISGYAFTGP